MKLRGRGGEKDLAYFFFNFIINLCMCMHVHVNVYIYVFFHFFFSSLYYVINAWTIIVLVRTNNRTN
jgi:hypothetical protein